MRAGAGQIVALPRRPASPAHRTADARLLSMRVEIAGVDAVFSRNDLTFTSCDLIVLLQHAWPAGRWWCRRGPRHRTSIAASATHTIASRSACGSADDPAKQVGHGVEGDAEQHAGKDQEQRRRERSGEQQQRLRTARCRCRRWISPTPDRCGPEDGRQRELVTLIPSHRSAHTLSQNALRDQAAARAGLTLARPLCEAMADRFAKARRGRDEFQVVRAAGAAGRARHR